MTRAQIFQGRARIKDGRARVGPDDGCCCVEDGPAPVNCEDCCTDSDETLEMVVTIPSGLSNKTSCTVCGESAGEYNTQRENACLWRFCSYGTLPSCLLDGMSCGSFPCDQCDGLGDGGLLRGMAGYPCAPTPTASVVADHGTHLHVHTWAFGSKCYVRVTVRVLTLRESSFGNIQSVLMAVASYYAQVDNLCDGAVHTLNLNETFACEDVGLNRGGWFLPISPGCNGSWPSTITIQAAA